MVKNNSKSKSHLRRLVIVTISGAVLDIAIILSTLEISRRDLIPFVATPAEIYHNHRSCYTRCLPGGDVGQNNFF